MKYVVVVDTDKMSTVWREAFDTIFAGESHSITSLVSGSTYKTAKRYKNFLTGFGVYPRVKELGEWSPIVYPYKEPLSEKLKRFANL